MKIVLLAESDCDRICYPTYLRNHEDGTKLNVGDIEGGDYFNEDKSSSGEYWGSLGTYSGAGYTVLLPSDNKTVAQTILSQLKDYLWITRGTRVVFLEFSLFNPNINVFSSIRLAWEIPITGGVTTSWDIETAKLTLYSTFFEKLVFVFEIVFIFLTACVFIEEVITWFFLGFKKYLTRMWTYITLLIFALSCSCIACSLYRYFSLNFVVSELSITGNQFIDIHHLVQLETIYKNSSALLTLLVWIKLFKYLSFSGNISRIVETLSRCAKNIGGFSIIFLIILLAFAQLGHIVFGQQVLAFRTFPLSVFTLWRFILGQFDFSKVSNANRFLGPTFFLTFIVFVFIILVNMFLAIINDSYHECAQEEKAEMSKKPVDPDATDEDCVACLSSSCAQRKSEKTRAFQDMKEICIDPSEIKDYLEYRKKYFSNVDIEMFMERFNIAENDALDGNEAHKLLTDIIYNTYIAKTELFEQIRKRHPDDNPLPTVTNIKQSKLLEKAHAEMLTERVGVIESTVVELVPKIEKFLTIIELQIEGQKNANIINNQNNAPKRRSLGSGFYKYDK
ncbi:polycystic kidney disease 2-like 1 protein [Folsomia candida]|uniref:polycystic kidney disease 2-like 1 protein n=1 Tax=Folsomia candida TaxID=158441 RepID=UPI0016050552|nr:polycystic kidney disease 2-like 1 protein [Folsomia candida]